MIALMMPSKEQMKEWEEGFAAQERIADIGVQAQREELRRRAARSARTAELTGDDRPVDGRVVFELRANAAIGQYATARTYGGLMPAISYKPRRTA